MNHGQSLQGGTSPFDRAKLMHLMEVFQHAVVDISATIEKAGATISAADLEDGRYVAGLATVSAANCEMLLQMPDSRAAERRGLYERFLPGAEELATAIRVNGFAKEVDDADFQ